jgi:GMP reductase
MDVIATFDMAKEFAKFNAITCLHKHYSKEDIFEFFRKNDDIFMNVWISTGISEFDQEKTKWIVQKCLDELWFYPNICVDVANGYSDVFVETCKKYREMSCESIIMAGNVCTQEMVQELILNGVDIVKCGIGPSKVCATREVAGVGQPQLSTILECADAAHGIKLEEKRLGLVCSDGGCKYIGDIGKAMGANSDFVMIGSMLAGHDECEGQWTFEDPTGTVENFINDCSEHLWELCRQEDIEIKHLDNLEFTALTKHLFPEKTAEFQREYEDLYNKYAKKKSLKFYGMSSYEAQDKYEENRKTYRASEGRVITVPYKGPVSSFLQEIQGGLRSTCTYTGATSLKDLGRCTTFFRVNRPFQT